MSDRLPNAREVAEQMMIEGRRAIFDIMDREAQRSPDYLEQIRENGQYLLSDIRHKDDAWLMINLADAGIPCSLRELEELTTQTCSSEEIFDELVRRNGATIAAEDEDRLVLCVMELCRRHHPTWTSMDNLDDRMQEGYDILDDWSKENCRRAVDVWGEAWQFVVNLAQQWNVSTVDDFDHQFTGVQSVFNWCQDYEMELGNAAIDEPSYIAVREQFAHDFERIFPNDFHGLLHLFFDASGALKSDFDDIEWDESWQDEDASEKGWISSADESGTKRGPVTTIKVGRNDPCPCGSGKKFKKCCGRPGGMY